MENTTQLLIVPIVSPADEAPQVHIDFPLRPLPRETVHELSRLARRWSRRGMKSKDQREAA